LYPPGRLGRGHVLVDGMVRATWIVTNRRVEVLHLDSPPGARDELRHGATEVSALLELDREPQLSSVD
jgi:hypothetical protein